MKVPTWKMDAPAKLKSRVGYGILIKPPQFKCAETNPSELCFDPGPINLTLKVLHFLLRLLFPKTFPGEARAMKLKRASTH